LVSAAQSNLKRNFTCLLLDGGFWSAGFASLGLFTIMPGLIHEIGLRYPAIVPFENRFATLAGLCFFGVSQLVAIFCPGLYETRARRLPLFMAFAWLSRLTFVYIALATIFMNRIGYPAYLVVLFASLLWYGVVNGFTVPQWMDFVARLTPVNRRGLLIGCRDCMGTVLGLAILAVFPVFTRMLPFPGNYGAMYSLSMVMFVASAFVLGLMREAPYEQADLKPRVPVMQHVRENLSILKTDRRFRNLLIVLVVLAIPGISNLSLITMKGIKVLDLSGASAAQFTGRIAMMVIVTNAVSILSFGMLGDKFGYRRIGYACFSILGVGLTTAMLATSRPLFFAAIVVVTMAGAGINVFMLNFPMEFAPENRRTSYMALRSLFLAPVIILPVVGGWLADVYGQNVVFAIALGFAVAGVAAIKFFVVDPRRVVHHCPEPVASGV